MEIFKVIEAFLGNNQRNIRTILFPREEGINKGNPAEDRDSPINGHLSNLDLDK